MHSDNHNMKKLIIANWKMNPKTIEEAKKLASAIEHRLAAVSDHTEVVICTPYIFLPAMSHYVHHTKLGAQNISWQESGALTGEISAEQLKPWKVEYAILGHSERRLYLGETDSVVNAKIITALKHKITPIVCLGSEDLAPQFAATTKDLEDKQIAKIVFVYEPTWAISTMKNSHPETGEHADQMVRHVYQLLERRIGKAAHNVRVLYGGTVNKNNVNQYAQYHKIDGALVGAASLDSENFWQIIKEFNRESIHR